MKSCRICNNKNCFIVYGVPQDKRKDCKEHHEVYQKGGASPHRRQRPRSHEAPDDHRICRVIQLLKKGPEENREKEAENLFPDGPFRDIYR